MGDCVFDDGFTILKTRQTAESRAKKERKRLSLDQTYLTSEQFGDEKLCYENNPEQSREVHFAKEEKRLRYEYLKSELLKELEK